MLVTRKKLGFSLIEILVGMFIMAIVLLSFFAINQSSSHQSMDAYYEFIGNTLGNNVIEFCQGMGYEWTNRYIDKPYIFPLDTWHEVVDHSNLSNSTSILPVGHYQEIESYEHFERHVVMKKILGTKEGSGNGILVQIELRIKDENKVRAWMSRNNLKFVTVVMEQPTR